MTIYCYILAKNQSYSTIRRASLLLKTFINTCLFTNKRVKKFLYKQLDETHVIQHEILYYLVFAFNMASKRKELNTSQHAQIIGVWKVGSSLRKIAQTLDHPYTTVQNVIKAYKDHGIVKPSPRKGRQKIMSERNKRTLLGIIKNDRKMTLTGRIFNLR